MNQKTIFQFNINGYEVEASYSQDFIDTYIKPLLAKWSRLANNTDQRIIIFLAAPPAAGKSTLAACFEYLSHTEGYEPIQALGMDGFHHYQSYIEKHTVEIQGKNVAMKSVKGCPESFDFERFYSFIQKIKQEDSWWPLYNRLKHDVEDNQIFVDHKIVLIEGNYLLLDEQPWNQLKELCDESIFIETNEDAVKIRLIKRKMQGGARPHEAITFYENSDGVNVRRIMNHRLASDVIFTFDGETYAGKKYF